MISSHELARASQWKSFKVAAAPAPAPARDPDRKRGQPVVEARELGAWLAQISASEPR